MTYPQYPAVCLYYSCLSRAADRVFKRAVYKPHAVFQYRFIRLLLFDLFFTIDRYPRGNGN